MESDKSTKQGTSEEDEMVRVMKKLAYQIQRLNDNIKKYEQVVSKSGWLG